ncbi:unnamed protein product [Ilex paraguariensis]|uniref:Uncharacterized protein n=1 Tax=Ilex paraguariensis TaxID=185542 RepID=A0ABC8QXG0_9AQUA
MGLFSSSLPFHPQDPSLLDTPEVNPNFNEFRELEDMVADLGGEVSFERRRGGDGSSRDQRGGIKA